MEAVDILDEACEEEVSFDWLFYCLMIYIYYYHSTVMFGRIDNSTTSFIASC